MRILIATDAFPPVCGGSGWSTYELARGLRDRGHALVIVQPLPGRAGRATTVASYDGFEVRHVRAPAPNIPYVRNYFKNERLYRQLAPVLSRIVADERIDLIHAQHVLTCPPAVRAARHRGVPVVCTIRDYWPVCYWSDLIHDYSSDALCPACSTGMMLRCIRPRAGAAWPLAVPLVSYMRGNLARKRQALALATAIVAVSSTIARDLTARAPELAGTCIETIPNPVDVSGIRVLASGQPALLGGPYAVYVGKLAFNKGIGKLLAAASRARLRWPLIVVGDGPERRSLEQAAAASGLDVRFTGWLDRGAALGWMKHATLLIFPSHGPESLSRVLLEASVLGVPIAAIDTGGTRDIVLHEETGLLSTGPDALGDHVARLVRDASLRNRLGRRAQEAIEARFDAPRVVARIEALYRRLLEAKR